MAIDTRFAFLKGLYDAAGADQAKPINAATIATNLAMDEHDLRKVTQYLREQGLIAISVVLHRIPAFVTITHAGIKAVEAGAI